MKDIFRAAAGVGVVLFATARIAAADTEHMGHPSPQTPSGHTHGAETGNVRTNDNVIDIYGRLYMSVVTNDYNETDVKRETLLTSHGSVLGVRGHKPIGGSSKLFWQIESDVDLDNMGSGGHDGGGNGSELASSDSFVGFSGGAGALLAGKHKTPFTLAVHMWDPFMHVAGDATGTFGRVSNYSSLVDEGDDTIYHVSTPNSIVYFSPDLSGFSLSAAVLAIDRVERESLTGQETSADSSRISGNSLSLGYTNGGLSIVYAFENHRELEWHGEVHALDDCDNFNVATDDDCHLIEKSRAQVLGMMYRRSGTTVSAIAESLKIEDAVVGNNDRVAYRIALKQDIGAHSFRVAYTRASEFEEDDGGSTLALGWFRGWSSNTTAYLSAVFVKNDDEANFGTFATGDVAHGSDPTTYALGVIHSF